VSTVATIGNALGLAILASVTAARTDDLLAAGVATDAALIGGYRLAFLLSAACAGLAAVISAVFLPMKMSGPAPGYAAAGAAAPAEDQNTRGSQAN
jgi:hypothetical protein